MPSTAVRLVIDDPENFHLLTTDMKEMIIQGAIATVNIQAALTRRNAVNMVKDNFTLRNNFTTSQIQFEQMEKRRFISLENITSRVGITEKADYMARQETGGERVTKNGTNLAIPTTAGARGGNKGSPVLKNLYLNKLKNKTVYANLHYSDINSQKHGSASGNLVAAAYIASRENKMLRYGKGLFIVRNFVKTRATNPANDRVRFKMDLIYNFQHRTTFTPENKWLWPASEQPAKDVENIFISQMKKLGM
jgi:hypothetical protein